jgi:HemX protein
MTDARTLLALAGALYGVGLGVSLFGMRATVPGWRRSGAFLLWIGFAMQSAGLHTRGLERNELPVSNVFEILHVLAWGVVAVDILLRLSTRVRIPDALISGLAALFAGVAFVRPDWDGAPSGAFVGNPWVGFHVGAIVLGFSFFAALAMNSLAYLAQHRALSSHRPGLMSGMLPPLRQLDRVGGQLLGVGLALLTLALAVGFAGLAHKGAESSSFKLVVAALVWAGYTAVFVMRRMEKIGGRGFARACLALFLLAMFSLWPANAVRKPVKVIEVPSGESSGSAGGRP